MKTFAELGVTPKIIKAVEELGFEAPMPVQEEVIPLLLAAATDIVALAQTGTGKTAAFGLPLIQQVDISKRYPQALILAPTRELCLQIADDLNDFAKYMDGLKIIPVYGGANIETQISALQKGVQIIVATPGRLIDLIKRKAARLDQVSKVVLDEADEMLNMGFTDSINTIFGYLPEERNSLLFSATMPPEIAAIAKNYMHQPKEVTIGTKNAGAENVKHVCYTVHARDKYLTLKRIADYYPNIYGIVFCRTRRETQEVADKLIQDGYNAESLHGDLSQSQRDSVMQKFRVKNIQLLVATDVAARGIDVDELTHVINYNLPDDISAYTHRSGRTGRAGRAGTSIAIINLKEKHILRQIEKKIGKQFVMAKVPSGIEICEKQLYHLIDKLERVEIEHTDIEPFLPTVYRRLEWLDKEELIKRLVSLEFNRFLQYYRGAVDLNIQEEQPRGTKDRGERTKREYNPAPTQGFTSLFINVGRIDGMHAGKLLEFVRAQTKGAKFNIGQLDILKRHSLMQVETKAAETVIRSFQNAQLEGRKIIARLNQENPERSGGGRPPMGRGRR